MKMLFFVLTMALASAAQWHDPSAHKVRMVSVQKDVQLEVLDWGGTGRPLLLLAGLGSTAHVFDEFAPKLTGSHHVYGVTRRGFGASSLMSTGYSADQLGDDVLAVIDSLALDRPFLIGHSIAGEELSSIGTRHPEKVAGLIYLESYAYAYYDPAVGDITIDQIDLQNALNHQPIDTGSLQKKLREMQSLDGPQDKRWVKLAQDLLQHDLPKFEATLRGSQSEQLLQTNISRFKKDLIREKETAEKLPKPSPPLKQNRPTFSSVRVWQIQTAGFSEPEAELRQSYPGMPDGRLGKPQAWATSDRASRAIMEGQQKYTDIQVPVLAIFAMKDGDPESERQAHAMEVGLRNARVIRLAKAQHFVFLSNEADVLREINAFLANH